MNKTDLEKWDKDIDDFSVDKQRLFDQLKKLPNHRRDSALMWRLSKACMYLSKGSHDKESQKQITLEALKYAEKACQLNPHNIECHKWYCVATGSLITLVCNNKERIKYGHDFKRHIDIALKMDSRDALLQFIYGRWCYGVATLSWMERKVANMPPIKYADALKVFKKANRLKPKWIECHLWVTKTLFAMKLEREAIKWRRNGLMLRPENILEEVAYCDLYQLKGT